MEALRQTKRMHPCKTGLGESFDPHGNGAEPMFMQMNDSPVTVDTSTGLADQVMDFNGTIPGLCSDYSGWGQFTSMVSSGLGNMDMFMNCDSFNF